MIKHFTLYRLHLLNSLHVHTVQVQLHNKQKVTVTRTPSRFTCHLPSQRRHKVPNEPRGCQHPCPSQLKGKITVAVKVSGYK